MRSKTASILHIGKSTLGRKNMGKAARRVDYLNAFSQAIDIAVEQEVDCVLSTGRLLQSRSPQKGTMQNVKEEISRLKEPQIPFLIVYSQKVNEHEEGFLSNLESEGLITPIGGKLTEIKENVFLYGVDAGYESMVREQHFEDVTQDDFLGVCLGDVDVESDGEKIREIDDRIPVEVDVFLAGKRAEPGFSRHNGIPAIDPGSTENFLSKTTLEEDPSQKGVNEYQFGPGRKNRGRHELSTRAYETFSFDISPETTVEDIKQLIADERLAGKAVLAELTGESPQPKKESVQDILEELSYCARVYDEREIQERGDTSTDQKGHEEVQKLKEELESMLSSLNSMEEVKGQSRRERLADTYAISSRLKGITESIRQDVRDELVDMSETGEEISGEFGVVKANKHERKVLREEDQVLLALAEEDISISEVTSADFDDEKLEEVIQDESVDIEEEDLYRYEISEYMKREEINTN
jgi:hypothetical protein